MRPIYWVFVKKLLRFMPPRGADQCNFKQLGWVILRQTRCCVAILNCNSEPRLAELTGKRGRNPNHKIEGKRQVVLKQVRGEAMPTRIWKWLKKTHLTGKLSKAKFQSFKIAMIAGRKTCAFLRTALSCRKREWRTLSKTMQPCMWLKLSAWGVPLLLSWYRGLSILVLKVVHLPLLCVCLLGFYCMRMELNLLIFARPTWHLASRSIAAKRPSGIVLSTPGRIWRCLLVWLHKSIIDVAGCRLVIKLFCCTFD